MKLTIVGACGSMSGPESTASCYLLQAEGNGENGQTRTYSLALDLGPGSFGQLWRYVDPAELDALVLSHLHYDHCADVMSLQIFSRWHPHRELEPLPLYAPPGMEERMRGLDGFAKGDDFSSEFSLHPLANGRTFQVGPFTIEPYAGWHSVESYALRVSAPSSKHAREAHLTYTGDSDLCASLVEAARGCDLLLSECGFSSEQQVRGIHLTPARAGELATLSASRSLMLTHIQPWTSGEEQLQTAQQTYSGPLALARPGMQVDI